MDTAGLLKITANEAIKKKADAGVFILGKRIILHIHIKKKNGAHKSTARL